MTNGGFNMCCKAVMKCFSTVIGLLVELITSIAKPKGSLEVYPYIRQPYVTVASNSSVISSHIFISFFFIIIKITNVIFHQNRGF